MNVLVIGSGGREHALCWKLRQSPDLDKLYAAPGNGGMAREAICVPLDTSRHEDVIRFCREKDIGLVVIGPEKPLVEGLADALEAAGLAAFGPSRAAAQLEGSKSFTKQICTKYRIPTAGYSAFTRAQDAKAFIREHSAPVVVKADGLAGGKGVVVAFTDAEAMAAVDAIFSGSLAGEQRQVLIEEYMEGEEISFFALTDGEYVMALGSAQDHKRAGEGDTGPNTGGMGAYSPALIVTESVRQKILEQIILPTVHGMASEGVPYRGVLFAGVMLTREGPKLLEYNARFGDPETQVLMPRLEGDLLPYLLACSRRTLGQQPALRLGRETALTVVLAARGYPGPYEKGTEIRYIDLAEMQPDVQVFHAGTRIEGPRVFAHGGRVMNVTAVGKNVQDARHKAYGAIEKIEWSGGFFRRDIGWRELQREHQAELAS